MKFRKGTPEFEYNMDAMHEMEESIPMTRSERENLHFWVQHGNDIDTNPWKIREPDGSPMLFLKALRVHQGYPHGPWDSWEYSDCIMPENPGFSVVRLKNL